MSEFIKVCPECLQECIIVTEDFGIGHYEYGGAKGIDVQIGTVTYCCEAEPKRQPWFDSENVPACHINGGATTCDVCPAQQGTNDCMDAIEGY